MKFYDHSQSYKYTYPLTIAVDVIFVELINLLFVVNYLSSFEGHSKMDLFYQIMLVI